MHYFLFFCLLNTLLWANDRVIPLTGHLGNEQVALVKKALLRAWREKGSEIVLQIHSSSGDLHAVLHLAQEIAKLKEEKKGAIVAYIQGKAVGPAAIFPFLADRLIVTPLVAWGDIVYGQYLERDHELLIRTVKQLVTGTKVRGETLKKLVDPMIDSRYQLMGEQEEREESERGGENRFDPLILNRDGMESLNLVNQVMTDEEFAEIYLPGDEKRVLAARYPKLTRTGGGSFPEAFTHYFSYSDKEENLIGYLEIEPDRPIDQTTYIYIKFALDSYKKKGVRAVILKLNTPGGEVLSSLKIVDLLQKFDVSDQIPIIAFIDDWAVSAGAMLAYACRFIGILPTSVMGAAEPVIMGQGGQMESASEKVNSALRTEFANLANFYGRNPLIAKAMVDKDLILVLRNHKIVELRQESDIQMSGPNPDIVITDKGKLLTLNAKELIDLGVADFEVPLKSIPPITKEEEQVGRWSAEKSLVFQNRYLATIPNAVMISYHDWRLNFFSILTHPVIASLLFMGLIIGFYIEINTPGFGIPGSIAMGCLSLILLSSFASEAINWIEIIILLVGIALLLLELFVIPGFGITGIIGIALTVIGLFALMLPGLGRLNPLDIDTFKLVGVGFMERLAWLCGSLIVSVVAIILLARFFSKRFFRFSKLILTGEQEKEEGYLASIPREKMPDIGELGETVTPLRPSGKVHIGDNLFDAITQGNYLQAYVPVEVIRIEGSKVVVRAMEIERK